ncbi:hypothetical protein JJQ51_00095 [Rhizobium sp. AG207R]|nr:hypothetical protein [Rhizobium sp. AG207R]
MLRWSAAKADPLDYRIKLCSKWADNGWMKCLEELKAKSDWTSPTAAPRTGRRYRQVGQPGQDTTCAAVAHTRQFQNNFMRENYTTDVPLGSARAAE